MVGGICCEIALKWMSLDFTDDQSTLVPVMTCCRQATSHYMSQYWPRSMSPNDVTRPQWVKPSIHDAVSVCHSGVVTADSCQFTSKHTNFIKQKYFSELFHLPNCFDKLQPFKLLYDFQHAKCIHISYHILHFIQQKKTKLRIEQPYILPILHGQYHACWCPGDWRSQGISRHGIDKINRNITVTGKIAGLRTTASKTQVRPVNLLYIIMFKIRKIKPMSGSVRQKPQSFHGDW